MPTESLKYLSQQTSNHLYDSVTKNIERYKTGDFLDLVESGGWSIELSLQLDLTPLRNLVMAKDSEAEIGNTMLVWNVLNKLHPSLACENRLWTRLTHVECLEYSRYRWLDINTIDDEKFEKDIKTHFFANTQTRYRDDNAISRLWWNGFIAKLAAPNNQEQALRMILKTADIRSNFIERSRTVSRPAIAAGIIRMMLSESWLTDRERNFREFMIALNKLGGGKVFEVWPVSKVDEFINRCFLLAQKTATA
jgi:hypothetical protein